MRRSARYRLAAVIDSTLAGKDALQVLQGRSGGVPLVASLEEALARGRESGRSATHFVIGLAPDGGRLPPHGRAAVVAAIQAGLHVDSGLHDFLTEDPELVALAAEHEVRLRDVRKPPPRSELHFFSGKIEEVDSLKIAVLGTDSAVGKRTTAWLLVDGLNAAGHPAELVGTGQTAWMQGARFGVIMDSLINDFVAGEIEHAVWSAWDSVKPAAIVIEGQGSLMNPAYPGGFEILAAGRPDVVVLQHAPARRDYDGFPGYPVHPLPRQIEAIELLSGKPVVAVALNREGLEGAEIDAALAQIFATTAVKAFDVLRDGAAEMVAVLVPYLKRAEQRRHVH